MENRKVIVIWRGDPTLGPSNAQPDIRYPDVLRALSDAGFDVQRLVYLDSELESAREALAEADAVLVWADPISADGDRTLLDDLLRDVAQSGARVYTHPDTILKMGTKDVLFDARSLSWSDDTKRYDSYREFVEQFPKSLSNGLPRVLKQRRGNGGIGVWKVEALKADTVASDSNVSSVRIQHAAPRDGKYEDILLTELWERMRPYFDGSGHLIDQAFARRVSEGMVRVYMVKSEVVGFARQYANKGDQDRERVPSERVFGIPAAKTMLDANDPEFAELRRKLEDEWIGGLQKLLIISDDQLPLLWDTDFLFGPKDESEHDTFLLCEINVSCVSPFPESAPRRLATVLSGELGEHRANG